MTHVVIEDVPASWHRYAAVARAVLPNAPGLVLHVAGPTDEGFRIIELWESEAAWRAFAPELDAVLGAVDPDLRPHPVVRELRAVHVVRGGAWTGAAPTPQE